MIITLSPTKILDFDPKNPSENSSDPMFEKEATELNGLLESISIDEIAALMKVNPQLAQSTYAYIHSFEDANVIRKEAIFVYNGIAFQGLSADTLSADDLLFAQSHLIILSGLYGMLRPLDKIKPYRLEMQTKLNNAKGKDLYAFWKDRLSAQLAEMMSEDDNIWVNLASNEYSKVIDRKKLPKGCRIITPVFKELNGDVYKQVTVHAKKARGMMARFITQNRIKEVEYIKAFDMEGYGYSEQLSNKDEWVFVR